MKSAIYIDDTGSTQPTKSKYNDKGWDSYVAVVLNGTQRKELSDTIRDIQNYFIQEFEVQELHFVEIFSGKGKLRKLPVHVRLKIFEVFADIYNEYRCPIYIQSLTDDDVIRNEMEHWRGRKKDGFAFTENSHFCLWLLLVRLSIANLEQDYKLPFEIFVDSGKQKPNTSQKISAIQNITEKSEIKYIDSKSDPLMQFIDYIAFTLNRCRWILTNDKKSEMDIELLRIAEVANFNTVNMVKKYVDVRNESTANVYDEVLRQQFDKNGNLSDEEVEKIKNKE